MQTAEASKRSLFEQRSRFQRALGALEADEPASVLENDSIEEADTSISIGYDGCVLLPELSSPCRMPDNLPAICKSILFLKFALELEKVFARCGLAK